MKFNKKTNLFSLFLFLVTSVIFAQNDIKSTFLGTWKIKVINPDKFDKGKFEITRFSDGTLSLKGKFKNIEDKTVYTNEKGTWWIVDDKYFQNIFNVTAVYEFQVINEDKIYLQMRSDLIEKNEIIHQEYQKRVKK